VQHFGRVAPRLVVVRRFRDKREQRFKRVVSRDRSADAPRSIDARAGCRSAHASRSINGCVVGLLDNAVEDESIAVARDRADVARLPRVVAERPPNRANGLTERAVGYDDVVPHMVEDVATVHRLVPVLDEIDQQVEIARDQRQLGVAARQRPSLRRDDEITEPVARHNVGG
jgi:hypothetical protein